MDFNNTLPSPIMSLNVKVAATLVIAMILEDGTKIDITLVPDKIYNITYLDKKCGLINITARFNSFNDYAVSRDSIKNYTLLFDASEKYKSNTIQIDTTALRHIEEYVEPPVEPTVEPDSDPSGLDGNTNNDNIEVNTGVEESTAPEVN